ncbi:MAG: hypothetical protein QW188_04905 [Candidatus Bathyarchaeia archaeon]
MPSVDPYPNINFSTYAWKKTRLAFLNRRLIILVMLVVILYIPVILYLDYTIDRINEISERLDKLEKRFFETQYLPTAISSVQPKYNVIVFKGGGFLIETLGEKYTFESSFSFPNAGYNRLVCQDKVDGGGEGELEVDVNFLSENSIEICLTGKYYRLRRLLTKETHRVNVKDTFTNLAKEDIGIIISNDVKSLGEIKKLYICGIDYSSKEKRKDPIVFEEPRFGVPSDNPTLFVGQENIGIGLVVEDDVFRVHLGVKYDGDTGCIYTRHFGLAQGSNYTLDWSIYIVYPPSYWHFINLVRRDWCINYTVEGPLTWFRADFIVQTPIDDLRRTESKRKWKLVGILPWHDYWDGYGLTREEYVRIVKPAIEKMKAVNPNVKVLMCVEVPLRELAPEEVAEYIDSIPILPNGELSIDKPYQREVPPERAAKGYKLYDVYPEVGNRRFRDIIDYIDLAMDVCRFDGIYFDSFMGHCYEVYYTYNKWDGHSVDIDPENFTVSRKYAALQLITREALKKIIDYVKSKGGVVVTNSRPPIRSIETSGIYTFYEKNTHVEGFHAESSATATHLHTPVCLGDISITDSLKDFMDDVRLHLKYGVLYYPYNVRLPEGQENYGVINHMFPFTPIALYEGVLIGEERIITMRSGLYGWGDKSIVKCYLFDKDGREIPADLRMKIVESDGKTYVIVTLDEGQIAIIERMS